MTNQYYVYILTNRTRRLYVGVTNDLLRRMHQHRQKLVPEFTSTYNITWLAYYETTRDVYGAMSREKQIKAWGRAKKIALVETMNPGWKDLSAEWHETSWIPRPPAADSE